MIVPPDVLCCNWDGRIVDRLGIVSWSMNFTPVNMKNSSIEIGGYEKISLSPTKSILNIPLPPRTLSLQKRSGFLGAV